MSTTNPAPRITSDPPLDDSDYDDEPSGSDATPLVEHRRGKLSTKKIIAIIVIILILVAVIVVVAWWFTTGRGCSKLEAPAHGNLSCSDDKCNFTCSIGYLLIGDKQLTCSKTKWSGKPPLCESPCRKLSVPLHGNASCANDTENINATCTFTCDKGYDMIGASNLTCTNGNWSGTPPVCDLVCPALPSPAHGNITCTNATKTTDATCSFVCDKGYSIIGPNERTCINGNWSGRQPVCQKSCPPLNPPVHGDMNCTNVTAGGNVTCTFSCDKGYSLKGDKSETCAKGKWSGPPPKCALLCPTLLEPIDGNATCSAGSAGTNGTCTYACNKGYTMVGRNKLICTNGTWNGSPPECLSGCPRLNPPTHGNMSCTNGTTNLNETCSFACEKGYALVGSKKLDCTYGKWSGKPPICASTCKPLSPPTHGSATCKNGTSDVNATCTFACDEGYNMTGPSQVSCTNGKWDGKAPICYQGCPALNPIDFGNFTCNHGHNKTSICNFTCNAGHNINGSKSLTCEPSGQWSHPEPECVCPKCMAGDKCQNSISYADVAKALDGIRLLKSVTVHYGGRTIKCSVSLKIIGWKWSGSCSDADGTTSECQYYKSKSEAAKHAASDLIRTLVSAGKCPAPCDPADLQTGCA